MQLTCEPEYCACMHACAVAAHAVQPCSINCQWRLNPAIPSVHVTLLYCSDIQSSFRCFQQGKGKKGNKKATYAPSRKATYAPSKKATYAPSRKVEDNPNKKATYAPSTKATYAPSRKVDDNPNKKATYAPS